MIAQLEPCSVFRFFDEICHMNASYYACACFLLTNFGVNIAHCYHLV